MGLHQTGLTQINLTIDARERPSTPIKLSEITTENRSIAIDLDSMAFRSAIVVDNFLFVASPNRINQFDFSGKLLRTFDSKRVKYPTFKHDDTNNKLLLFDHPNEMSVWDLNGNLLINIVLPKDAEIFSNVVIGFEQNFVYILQYILEKEKVTCRISRLNIVNERLEKIMEHDFILGSFGILPNIPFSSVGGKSYVSIPNNTIYQIIGTQAIPVVKYDILNFKEAHGYHIMESRLFLGRYIFLEYGYAAIGNKRLFLYDTIEKRSWHTTYELEDDIFHTGTIKHFRITSNGYLIFIKEDGLPINTDERSNAVFFISKLKQ